jgi:hypothetical protein
MRSTGRSGAFAGSPPAFSGKTSNVDEQPASIAASESSNEAARGAERLRRAFDIIAA